MFLLVVNGEVARRRRGSWFSNVPLHRHEETVPLFVGLNHEKVLRRKGKPDLDLGRIVRFVRDDAVVAR